MEVFHRGELLQPPELDEGLVETLYVALYEGKRLQVRYLPKMATEPKSYVVNPLGLVLTDNLPYLIVSLRDYPDIKQMALQRFEAADLLDEPATPPPDFSLQEYLRSGEFSYRKNDALITLKIRMDKNRARHLRETKKDGARKGCHSER